MAQLSYTHRGLAAQPHPQERKWRWGGQPRAEGGLSSAAVRSLTVEVQTLRDQVQLQHQELDLYEEELVRQAEELRAARDRGRFLAFQQELLVDMWAMRVLDAEQEARGSPAPS